MRFGILPNGLNLDRPIWIHAVSVGEVMAVKNLLRELRIVYPEKRFFISTVTPTGNKIAKGIAKETDFVSYFPLDLSFIVRSVVDKVKPSLFIIMETEIWPNLISCLNRKNIPIVLVNGRLS
ncbi:MAG: glycosyltransferase N-terminal domain-containing protein, partial [Candidatus Omnitrophota bacterium]|nr:glycosyltransferase N-terminal domain-containing protein [Candidatus Omnitrophota bacterium]